MLIVYTSFLCNECGYTWTLDFWIYLLDKLDNTECCKV